MGKVLGLHSYLKEHLRSYPVRLPFEVEQNHRKWMGKWHQELTEWSDKHDLAIQIHPKPLGDPHAPGGIRASRLIIGPGRVSYIWKAGDDRFKIEKGLQEMIEVLGPSSGLLPINGMPLAGGGAWRKVKIISADKDKDRDYAARAAAHILFLITCFNLPDLHDENFVWTRGGFRIIDGEFFCGPTWVSSNRTKSEDRRYIISERLYHSVFAPFIASKFGGDGFAGLIIDNLKFALNAFSDKWDKLYSIRAGLDGLNSRIIHRGTSEYARLMPFLMSKRYRDAAIREFNKHVPPDFDRESALEDLGNGCIPIHRSPIGRHDDPVNGAIRPDDVMLGTIKAQLLPGVLAAKPTCMSLGEILSTVRVEDPLRLDEPAFGALAIGGIVGESASTFDDSGLCHGLGGLVLLHAAERYLGIPHSIEGSDEVAASQMSRMRKSKLNHGVNIGVAGDFMLGWALNELGQLSSDHIKVLDERLGYLETLEGCALDLAVGLAGDLLGLVRASSYLGHRKEFIKSTAERIVSLIESEYQDAKSAGVLSYGFAHGLAGVALALVQAERRLGARSAVTTDIIKALSQVASNPHERLKMKNAKVFCYNDAGLDAVLRFVAGEDAGWSPLVYEYPELPGGRGVITNSCCGVGAYHLGRIRGIGEIPPSSPCQTTSVWGYYGIAGYKYLEINENAAGMLPDPIWGRLLLKNRSSI